MNDPENHAAPVVFSILNFEKCPLPLRILLLMSQHISFERRFLWADTLKSILESLLNVSEQLEVVFPVHPRTRGRIAQFGIDVDKLHLLEPVPYIEFLTLQRRATAVITDSGGIQEETTYLQVPCLTVRSNTERPITVTMGTNILVGQDSRKLAFELSAILEGRGKQGIVPPLWDECAAERIADVLRQL